MAYDAEHFDRLGLAQDSQFQRRTQRSAENAVVALGEQTELLEALKRLSEELGDERRDNAEREAKQQGFNRRMSWAALLLAGAAVIVPFGILLIEQAMR